MSPIVLPASSKDLTTLEAVRREQQKPPGNTDQDAVIGVLITAASRHIMRHCEREFAPASQGVTRTFEWPWESEIVSLAPYDLRTITSIYVDTDVTTNGTLVPATDYRPWPVNSDEGTYTALRIRPLTFSTGRVLFPERQIKVTGDWGFAAIPESVQRACTITVIEWLRDRWLRDPAMTADIMEQTGGIEPGRPSSLPYAARALLAPYNRPSLR